MDQKPAISAMIDFRNATKKFGNFTAVDHVNFQILRGEILGFLGPNGAGKSTTMKLLASLLRTSEGEIWIRHHEEMQKLTPTNYDLLLDNIGFLIETPAFYDHMTPRQHLTYFAKLKGFPRNQIKDRVESLVSQIGMKEWIDKPIKTFSKGMQQKIGILAAIVHDPAIVVLDEPTSGLDPQASRELRDFIVKLKKQGKTIFISSHLLFEISEIADRVAVIMHGKLVACDTLENLKAASSLATIRLELVHEFTTKAAQEMIEFLTPLIKPLCGLDDQQLKHQSPILFNPETKAFEIRFNGQKSNQYSILQKLIQEGVQVTDFSLPKASLLESLYLNLTKQADSAQNQITKSKIKVEDVL